MLNNKRILIFILLVISIVILTNAWVFAQLQGDQWTPPLRLSTDEGTYLDRSTAMVADPYGSVHVFWVETGFEDKRAVVQHTSFDGENWSHPVDVVATKPMGELGTVSTFLSSDNILYLMWTAGVNGPVFYSTASVQFAGNAAAWSTPVRVDIPAFQAQLLIDSQQVFHLVYTNFYGEEPGVFVIQSADQGQSWTEPTWLDPDIPTNFAPLVMQAALDVDDGLHVLWAYQDLSAAGADVRYSHSLDGGQTWTLPFTIDSPDEAPDELRLPEPSLAVSGSFVYVIWAGNSATNREFRFSTDRGQSWSVPIRVFGDLLGQALGDGTAIDSLGRLQFVGQLRWPQGLYHYSWDGRSWSAPELFYLIQRNDQEGIGSRIHAHNVKLAVGQGNLLVTTFTDNPGGPLYAMTRRLSDAPAMMLGPATLSPTPTVSPATPSPEVATSQPSTIIIPTPRSFDDVAPPLNVTTSPEEAIAWGVSASVLLVLGIFIVVVHQRNR